MKYCFQFAKTKTRMSIKNMFGLATSTKNRLCVKNVTVGVIVYVYHESAVGKAYLVAMLNYTRLKACFLLFCSRKPFSVGRANVSKLTSKMLCSHDKLFRNRGTYFFKLLGSEHRGKSRHEKHGTAIFLKGKTRIPWRFPFEKDIVELT